MNYRVFYPSGQRILCEADSIGWVEEAMGPVFLVGKDKARVPDPRSFITDENSNVIYDPRDEMNMIRMNHLLFKWMLENQDWPKSCQPWQEPYSVWDNEMDRRGKHVRENG